MANLGTDLKGSFIISLYLKWRERGHGSEIVRSHASLVESRLVG